MPSSIDPLHSDDRTNDLDDESLWFDINDDGMNVLMDTDLSLDSRIIDDDDDDDQYSSSLTE